MARIWELIQQGNVVPALLLNLDESFLRYRVPLTRSYSPVGAKVVPAGSSNKGGLTVTPVITASGHLVGMQVIPDKVRLAEPPDAQEVLRLATQCSDTAVSRHFRFSYCPQNPTKWQTTESLQQLIREIILPYVLAAKEIASSTEFAVMLIDVAPAHIKREFRDWLATKEVYEHLRCVFVPANCTSKLQPLDLSVQRPLKHGVRSRGNEELARILLSAPQEADEADLRSLVKDTTSDRYNLNRMMSTWLPHSIASLSRKGVQSAFDRVAVTKRGNRLSLTDIFLPKRRSELIAIGNDVLKANASAVAFEDQPALKRALHHVPLELRDSPFAALSCPELRSVLRSRGLQSSGCKADLVKRLQGSAVAAAPAAEEDHEISSVWQAFEALTEAEYQADEAHCEFESFAEFRAHLTRCKVTERLHGSKCAPVTTARGKKRDRAGD